VGEVLERSAVRGAGTAGWLGIAQVRERDWTLRSAGLDLHSGLPGITFFLAYLAAVTREQRYRDLAEAALENIRTLLTHPRKQEAIKHIGAFDGWGGVIYLFSHLGSLWKAPALYEEAEELLQVLPELIEQDEQFDIIGGAAGCVASLLSLYAVTPASTILELAIRCGDRLLACAHRMQEGIGWKIPLQDVPLTGFSHGNAGIALSLLRLAAARGEERFHQASMAALAYERSQFSAERCNWPDLQRPGVPARESQASGEEGHRFLVSWCHGAPGIGLARLASLPYLDDATLRQEIAAALQTTLAPDDETLHMLCCGTAGKLETLLVASQMLKEPHIEEQVRERVGWLLDRVPAPEEYQEPAPRIEPLGLMTGLAGIGYELLRVSHPAQVPSVLALAPPVP
jgi:type 2 lantibiotic biosynthesis protein LanM